MNVTYSELGLLGLLLDSKLFLCAYDDHQTVGMDFLIFFI
uniref:Uncharacterized protein n=1 Tax=Rhizophora mucronata TaxID=61149 RepID=A0A2P2NV04_RHIMU